MASLNRLSSNSPSAVTPVESWPHFNGSAAFSEAACSSNRASSSSEGRSFASGSRSTSSRLSGNSTCNSFSGSYTASGAGLTIGELVSTMMACADPILMQQESDYVNALSTTRGFTLAGDQLTLSYDGGELRFTRQVPVADRPLEGRWQLTTFATGETASSLLAGTEINAELAGGKISGKGGCNSYFGSYTTSGASITISQVGSTKMACSGEIMAQENAFLSALAATTGYSVAGDQLTLSQPGGQLIFTAAP